MTRPAPSFIVHVDATNPGQFFACCGLLELAHRLWPGVEGWFDAGKGRFAIIAGVSGADLEGLVATLKKCEVSGLTKEERDEREALKKEKRNLTTGQSLPADKEGRRKELGEKARRGTLRLGSPIGVLLDWWQTTDDEATPKTWAGRQEIQKVARAAQIALPDIDDKTALFDHRCVLQLDTKKVEPFYFDARRFSHSLDVGFSLDMLGAETIAHPAVELLSLIGLQRFRPSPAPIRRSFDYWTWSIPLRAPVAAGVAGGSVPTPWRVGYRFPLKFRDDQRRYKAFGRARMIGGEDT